jgi:DNA processing protein
MTDTAYWIWFQLVFGVGSRRSELLLNYFESPAALYEEIGQGGRAVAMLEEAERQRLKTADDQAEILLARTLKKGCTVITPDHDEYPPLLREIYARPAALYVKGDISCLGEALCIAVIGSREAGQYGVNAAKTLSYDLAASGVVIVSGLARGIDSVAHEAALKAGGKTVGFLGCGIDVDYPKGSSTLKRAICENGAVVSEFPLGTEPLAYRFPIRNRVVSGVSHGVLVAEARKNSGALLTADHALEQGRNVYVVPGDITSPNYEGSHKLLKEGAKAVDCAADILIEFPEWIRPAHMVSTTLVERPETPPPPAPPIEAPKPAPKPSLPARKELPDGISPEAAAVYPLIGEERIAAEEIGVQAELPIGKLLAALTELEIYGLIKLYPGRLFGLNTEDSR